MTSIHELAIQGLDLEGKAILDAATGAGEATKAWTQHIHANNIKARIISVDIDQPEEWVVRIKENLGTLKEYVELRQADIYNLDFLPDASIDRQLRRYPGLSKSPTPQTLVCLRRVRQGPKTRGEFGYCLGISAPGYTGGLWPVAALELGQGRLDPKWGDLVH